MTNQLLNAGTIDTSQREEAPMPSKRDDQVIPRTWGFCKSFPQGQLLESESDYKEAEEHTAKTGEVWYDSPTKVVDEIAEEEATAKALAEEEAAAKAAKTTKKT